MNRERAMQVADAVLYEGYMLYPYRPSAIKNRQRWSFGILYPPAYVEVLDGTERSHMHSECLLRTTGTACIQLQLRFLHLLARQVSQFVGDHFEPVRSLLVDGKSIETWDEGVERSAEMEVQANGGDQHKFEFSFAGLDETETLTTGEGKPIGELRRSQDEIRGAVSFSSQVVRDGVTKLTINVTNATPLPAYATHRNSALLSSFLSAHTILTVMNGEFVSLLDPPGELCDEVAACNNVGNFPVLVGQEDERDMLLCSPIVLYDYPQVAPESAGDFYDATEMDEMLTLRVMTLTDEEKGEMSRADEHARLLLRRTEESAREQLMRTHGTIRGLRRASGE